MKLDTLPNGLRLLVVPNEGDESATVDLCGFAGSGYEKDSAGAAHFLEHVLFDGTKNYQTIQELDAIVNNRGSRKNGMTSKDYARYSVKSLPEEVESSFIYLSEIMLRPLLRQHDIDREKTIIEQEINRFKDDPSLYLPRKIYSQLYPSSPLGRFVTGDVDEIKRLEKGQIDEYWESHYVARNFVMVVAGKVVPEKIKRLAEKYFGEMRPGESQAKIVAAPNKLGSIVVENRDNLKQSHFLISYPGFAHDDEQRFVAEVLVRILARGFSSRLYVKLRVEKAMIYSLRGYAYSGSFGGSVGITTAVDQDKLNEALEIVNQEIDKVMEGVVTDEELARGINLAASDALFNQELNENLTSSYAYDLLLLGRIIDPATAKEKYHSVTRAKLQEVAIKLFSGKPNLLALTQSLQRDNIKF
ncbi:MAG: pitrilysin family protein [bacterium]|nr:pitrilysin family protein [bacterium]